jgi:hypothetical protein
MIMNIKKNKMDHSFTIFFINLILLILCLDINKIRINENSVGKSFSIKELAFSYFTLMLWLYYYAFFRNDLNFGFGIISGILLKFFAILLSLFVVETRWVMRIVLFVLLVVSVKILAHFERNPDTGLICGLIACVLTQLESYYTMWKAYQEKHHNSLINLIYSILLLVYHLLFAAYGWTKDDKVTLITNMLCFIPASMGLYATCFRPKTRKLDYWMNTKKDDNPDIVPIDIIEAYSV